MASPAERLEQVREHHPFVDHVVRMQAHYGSTRAGQQAGAITYFAFLSFFPVLALAFFAVGLLSQVLDGADQTLRSAVTSLFPGIIGDGENQLRLRDFRTFSGLAGLLGLAGVLYAGLGWVSALRQALVTVFELPEEDRLGFVAGKLRDLLALVTIGVTLLVAVAVSGLVSGFSADLLRWAGLGEELSWFLVLLTVVLGLAANALLFYAMFRLLGRSELPTTSLVSGAVVGALLFEVLKRLAGLVIAQTQGQPAFQAFGIALTMIVWMNYFSRLVLYAACWAWTTPQARAVRDAAAAARPVAPVQGPALPSGDDAVVLPDGDGRRRTGARAFAAGAATVLGLTAASRRRKDSS